MLYYVEIFIENKNQIIEYIKTINEKLFYLLNKLNTTFMVYNQKYLMMIRFKL